MSIVAVKVFGLSEQDTVVVLLSLTIVAIAMSFAWGWIADRLGPKRTLVNVLVSWAVGLLIGGVAMGFGPGGLALVNTLAVRSVRPTRGRSLSPAYDRGSSCFDPRLSPTPRLSDV